MNQIVSHEFIKLLITNRVAFQTASLERKVQIVSDAKHKVDSVILFLTIFSSFFLLMMTVRSFIIL
jgi:hypothetical protein